MVVARGKFASTNQKHHTDLGRNKSVSMGKLTVRSRNVTALFSGYSSARLAIKQVTPLIHT